MTRSRSTFGVAISLSSMMITGATALVQLVPLLALVWMSRRAGFADTGVLASVLAVAGLASVIGQGGTRSVMVPELASGRLSQPTMSALVRAKVVIATGCWVAVLLYATVVAGYSLMLGIGGGAFAAAMIVGDVFETTLMAALRPILIAGATLVAMGAVGLLVLAETSEALTRPASVMGLLAAFACTRAALLWLLARRGYEATTSNSSASWRLAQPLLVRALPLLSLAFTSSFAINSPVLLTERFGLTADAGQLGTAGRLGQAVLLLFYGPGIVLLRVFSHRTGDDAYDSAGVRSEMRALAFASWALALGIAVLAGPAVSVMLGRPDEQFAIALRMSAWNGAATAPLTVIGSLLAARARGPHLAALGLSYAMINSFFVWLAVPAGVLGVLRAVTTAIALSMIIHLVAIWRLEAVRLPVSEVSYLVAVPLIGAVWADAWWSQAVCACVLLGGTYIMLTQERSRISA